MLPFHLKDWRFKALKGFGLASDHLRQRHPVSAGEHEAAQLDDGNLYEHYRHDEKEIQVFEGLKYSPERQAWLAQFRLVVGANQRPWYLTHAEVLNAGRTLLAMDTKPSQCLKASRAFGARIDRAANQISFDL